MVAAYFKTNESFQGHTNSQLLAKLLSLLQECSFQYILVGDWDNLPSSFPVGMWPGTPSSTRNVSSRNANNHLVKDWAPHRSGYQCDFVQPE